jgi:hypothetical protein
MNMQRMRVGLLGRLLYPEGDHSIAALYSLDGHASRGRLRPQDPTAVFPSWLAEGSHLRLYGYDRTPFDITITLVKLPREGWKNDDHFAEFVVRQVTH